MTYAEHYEADVAPACERLLSLPEPPTALIAGSDVLALRWLRALGARGVRLLRV